MKFVESDMVASADALRERGGVVADRRKVGEPRRKVESAGLEG